ncbi:sensor histidine kinase [Alloiococcus sp. CFN-8]|uniref:sensor histidine kinase n=1 Tax=Alloiococcus sp. CFN-8 TaxID=3416081 RepID=UPI003CF0D86A
MDILFFLRCLETVGGVVGMNLSLGSLKKNVRFTMVVSTIMLITACGIMSILYSNFSADIIEKTYILIMIVGIGATIIINTNDKLWVVIFNFFVQFLIYSGISMICTGIYMMFPSQPEWIYLLTRAIAFPIIIYIEVKYIRKHFRYFLQIINSGWHIYLILILSFFLLITLLCAYPTMYYDRPFYSLMEIVLAYILLALVLYGMYYTMCNTIEKYALLESEKRIKEEVKYMEDSIKMKEDIFANVSHEFKTPLNLIVSSNQLIEVYLKNDQLDDNKEKALKNINTIKDNCYRFTKLINNILDISKIDSGFLNLNLRNENIVSVVENIVDSVSEYIHLKGLTITFDTNTEERVIACDSEQIERVILNLISNAIKFTNSGGSIFINIIDKGHTVEIEVKDTGIGIEAEYFNRIFNRFHQVDTSLSRNAEGTGIGLFIVKSLVELHGGSISVHSEVGKGSTFKIELPVKTLEATEAVPIRDFTYNIAERVNVELR